MRKIFIAVLAAFWATSCASTETVESTRVAAAEIHQQISVNATRSATEVSATFRVGNENGKTVDLDAPSKIELNGREMTETAPGFMTGTTYRTAFEKFTTPLQFVYTGGDGKIYSNEAAFAPLEIVSKNIILSRRKPAVIKLSRAVGADEKMTVTIAGRGKDKTGNSLAPAFELDAARTSATIKTTDLGEILNGRATLGMHVEGRQSLKKATAAGGQISFNYQAGSTPVKIVN